jgi:fibro-slime domain-containing protein
MTRQRAKWAASLLVAAWALLLCACGGQASSPSGGSFDRPDAGGSSTGGGSPVTFIDGGLSGDGSPDDGGACVLEDGAPCVYDLVDAGPHCGDGQVNVDGEECDDGNNMPGDGCSGTCTQESEFWDCPPEGGPCVTTMVCGDGARVAVEACDDGNTDDGDGCSSTCTLEPGYFCPTPGEPCEPLQDCGDGRLQPGEVCDDANRTPGDGCDANCREEPGYRCIRPGIPCELVPVCGDGQLAETEGCDDGNAVDGDGCSASCIQEAAYYDCSVPGQACVYTVECGDGVIEDVELCDDGNSTSGDGCSSDCQIESGWACRLPGAACVPNCGDGQVVAGIEECDDGGTANGDGCSVSCMVEPGWSCTGAPSTCTASVCGNGVQETGEQCDLGEDNGLFYGDGTGCSKTCTNEPLCRDAGGGPTRACDSVCGDGMIVGDEACDDGNRVDGDGCSSACVVEEGFICNPLVQSDAEPCSEGGGDCLILPIILRDFRGAQEADGHPDFFYMGANGVVCVPDASGAAEGDATEQCLGLVNDTLNNQGKPTYSGDSSCPCQFTDWDETGILNNVSGVEWNNDGKPYIVTTVDLIDSTASFDQWYNDVSGVNVTVRDTLELEEIGNGQFQFSSSDGRTVLDDVHDEVPLESGFFPLEDVAGANTLCNLWPYWVSWSGCEGNQWDPIDEEWKEDAEGVLRNFYFTSEVRYLFHYQAGVTFTLSFFGDDDVWVFVNGNLALDLGGTHQRLDGDVVVSSATGGDYGLTGDNVYEIVVYHADRHPRDSNYQLTLSGFETEVSDCVPECGDGVRTVLEQCDLGTAGNTGEYNGCNADCTFGPFCGDGVVQPDYEECDDGQNTTIGYNMSGCAPGCVLPPRCGDGELQPGEECDDGLNEGGYDGCESDCTLGPYCGDGVVQAEFEECDDGLNIGGYGQCAPGCVLGPRCGDGIVQEEFGELCDDANDIAGDGCTNCGNEGYCGDGIVQTELGETCDDGVNDGSYGHCSIDCQPGPTCGDGIVQAEEGEECDFGSDCSRGTCNADGVYGGCSTLCKIGPYCGDGIEQIPPEECDDGNDINHDGCSTSCLKEARVE